MEILEIKNVTKTFGGLTALQDVKFKVSTGEIVGIIGPNGAGKTSLFNVISGFYRPTRGEIFFKGYNITGMRPDQIVKKGLVRSFQSTMLFYEFTVLQNLIIGHHLKAGSGSMWRKVFSKYFSEKEQPNVIESSLELIKFVGLDGLENELAINLPHGRQRALGLAIALAAQPNLLMLDEPVTGMNQEEMRMMMDKVYKTRDNGISVLLVEHHMRMVMEVCDRIVVLNYGVKIAEGKPEEIINNRQLIEVYLGKSSLNAE